MTWILVGLCLLLLAGYVILRVRLMPAAMEKTVRSLLAENIAGEWTIGQISLDGISGLAVKELRITPDSGGGEISASQVVFRPKLLPLLWGGVQVRAVEVNGLRVVLAPGRDGWWSLCQLPAQRTPEAVPQELTVRRASLVWRPERRGREIELTPLDLHMTRTGSVAEISGEAMGTSLGSWRLNAEVKLAEGRISGTLQGHTIPLSDELRDLLPPLPARIWDEARLSRGTAETRIGFEWPSASGKGLSWRGALTLLDCSLSPRFMPYTLADTTVDAELDPQKISLTFSGEMPTGTVRGGGEILMDRALPYLDLTASVNNLILGQQLAATLDSRTAALWRRLRPEGVINGEIRIQGRVAEDRFPGLDARLRLSEGSLSPSELPEPVRDISCLVRLDTKRIMLFDLKAAYEGATISLPYGQIPLDSTEPFELAVHARDLPVSSKLLAAVPQPWLGMFPGRLSDELKAVTFSGNAGVLYRLSRSDQESLSHDVTLTLGDVKASHPMFPVEVTGFRGVVRAGKDHLQLTDGRGELGEATIEVRQAGFEAGEQRPILFDVAVNGVQMDEELEKRLPGALRRVVQTYALRGPIDVEFAQSEDSKPPQVRTRVVLKDCSVGYADFPYMLNSARGEFAFTGGRLRQLSLSGVSGPAKVNVAIQKPSHDDIEKVQATIEAAGLPLDKKLQACLPPSLLAAWNRVQPAGTIGLDLELNNEGDGEYQLSGRVEMKDVSLRLDVPVESVNGSCNIEQSRWSRPSDADGLRAAKANLTLGSASAGGVRMAGIRAAFEIAEDVLRVNTLAAESYGGTIEGSLALPLGNLDKQGARELGGKLMASGISAAQLCNDVGAGFEGLEGTLEATCSLSGSGRGWKTITGAGSLRIAGGKLDGLPGVDAVMSFFRLPKTTPPMLHAATYRYNLANGVISPTELELSSREVTVTGKAEGPSEGDVVTVVLTPTLRPAGEKSAAVREVVRLMEGREVQVELGRAPEDRLWKLNPLLVILRVAAHLSLMSGG